MAVLVQADGSGYNAVVFFDVEQELCVCWTGSCPVGSLGLLMQAEIRVDACGLACPMPLLKLRLALNGMAPGEVLLLEATDGGALRDIPRFAELAGHQMLAIEQQETGVIQFLLRKAQA